MILFLMVLSLAGARTSATPVTPCVWPNRCAVEVAQFKPCVWPNRCAAEPAPVLEFEPRVAQFKPCVWPNRCAADQA